MKTVAIISQKGGSGKTTLAIHLAVAADIAGRAAVIVDLDPQASASSWRDMRTAETPIVVSAQASRLPHVIGAAATNGAELVIIDTAPHSEKAALDAIRAADMVVIPCRPAILDLRAIHSSVDLLRIGGKPGAIVLNAVPPRGALGDDASEAAMQYGVPVSPCRLSHRAVFQHCLTAGQGAQEYEPTGKAADEARELYKWTCKQVGLKT